jgi:hypothetical protein
MAVFLCIGLFSMSGIEVTNHFSEVTRMVQIGSESRRNITVVS